MAYPFECHNHSLHFARLQAFSCVFSAFRKIRQIPPRWGDISLSYFSYIKDFIHLVYFFTFMCKILFRISFLFFSIFLILLTFLSFLVYPKQQCEHTGLIWDITHFRDFQRFYSLLPDFGKWFSADALTAYVENPAFLCFISCFMLLLQAIPFLLFPNVPLCNGGQLCYNA